MSKITLTGNASGTGVVTLTSPNTNTNRTITLPDATATIATQENFTSTGIDDNATSTAITIAATTGNVELTDPRAGLKAKYDASNSYSSNLSWRNLQLGSNSENNIIGGNTGVNGYLNLVVNNTVDIIDGAAHNGTIGFSVLADGKARAPNGLLFGTDTAAANALDDYEEGTWTPTTSTGTMTFNAAKTVYTKIGNLVTISVDALSFSDITSTNGIVIGGLPFTSSASNKSIGAVISNYNNKASTIAHMSSGRLTVEFYQSNATGTWVQDTHSSLNNTGNNRNFTISYVV